MGRTGLLWPDRTDFYFPMDQQLIPHIGESLTLWSVRLALLCYFIGLAGILLSRNERTLDRSRLLWSLGCCFFLAHLVTAFHFYHAWSHESAVLETTRQSAEVVGVEAGYGIYMNYIFGLLWTWDAIWWRVKGHSGYLRRPKSVAWVIHGYLLFIVINGTLIFESGPVRWFSAAMVLVLAGLFTWSSIEQKTRTRGEA